MYKAFYAIVTIFWILDILNFPFMQMFDTTHPINGWAWFLIWLFLPSTSTVVEHYKNK
jgi:hypothetical protein